MQATIRTNTDGVSDVDISGTCRITDYFRLSRQAVLTLLSGARNVSEHTTRSILAGNGSLSGWIVQLGLDGRTLEASVVAQTALLMAMQAQEVADAALAELDDVKGQCVRSMAQLEFDRCRIGTDTVKEADA